MTLVKSLFLSGAIASLTASIALADPKPANSVNADPQTVANAFAGKTMRWKNCKAGVYYGGKWEAQALCEKDGSSIGLGKWSVTREGAVCIDLVFYWDENGETKSQPQERNPDCIYHVVDPNGQVWHRWEDDTEWWRGFSDNLVKGFKYKGKIRRLRRKLDV